jgi:hypothetical protein
MQPTLAEESILAEESAKSSANSSVQQGCQLVLDSFLSHFLLIFSAFCELATLESADSSANVSFLD